MVFPGQGSQSVGMLAELASLYPEVKHTFDEASEALGLNLWALSQTGPDSELNLTWNTQPAMLAADIAVARVWQRQSGPQATVVAGHSLGEYAALVAAGSIKFADAIRLVAARGRFMQEAVPEGQGAMAAILGLEDAQVLDVCAQAAAGEVVEAVNFNSPGQVVIAGNVAAVNRAVELAKTAGAKRAVMLPVSVPSHCSLMKPAAERLAALLTQIEVNLPEVAVLHNVDVQQAADADEIRQKLAQQLFMPVQWVRTVQEIAANGINLVIEAGPGKVLAGLNRRIEKNLTTLAVTDPAGLDAALEAAHAE